MAILNDENTETFTGVADTESTGTVEVNSSDNGEHITAFFDDGSGNAPGAFEAKFERYSPSEDRWMTFAVTTKSSPSHPISLNENAVPEKVRVSVTNNSGASADFRISVVSY